MDTRTTAPNTGWVDEDARSANMSELVLPNSESFQRQWHAMPARKIVLAPAALEHGAYYAGTLGGATAAARWHAKKRRFVFSEFILGSQRVRSVAHLSDQ